ncbi:ABC transporter substrate-binding protein [Streptomyces albipurpureus]|uniref:ABC transporter substrate-binding protein n=1 Tax=Streptomyces albipurpureus TaxID=2897419 RepID=A0ABT0UWP2_9ACTN|nr:ABC transporter substrate-binding protein [Streptomyces sp. CWNU-1]MCM2391601.1 ABC transporter substrate-binding protein [Streptomyces sp. CWNU-1]
MFYRTCLQSTAALASISLLAGCGLFAGDEGGDDQKITVGTTSEPTTLDPAAAWDGSWELYRNVYQTLLSFPTGSTMPQPDAAQRCEFTDTASKKYECTLKPGLLFSNGEKLNAQAVKHSITRVQRIASKDGPSGLLSSLGSVEIDGELKVKFFLKTSDATFPFILATPATSLVAPLKYPIDKLRSDGGVTGSGPYKLTSYTKNLKAELVKNGSYRGYAKMKNSAITIRYYRDSEIMVGALKRKKIDATFRGLTAKDVEAFQKKLPQDSGLQVIETVGADIRYLVFNPKDPVARKLSVRKAVAQIIDRGALIEKVYQSTAEPLYSMIPRGIAGHTTKFFDIYGEPSVAKAKKLLRDDGITKKVNLTLWYSTDRYGSVTGQEFAEIKAQLEASGLFKVTIDGEPEAEFRKGYQAQKYPVFGRGWFPDFPDPDNFIFPFVGESNVLFTPYVNSKITGELLTSSRKETNRGAVSKQFEEAQEIIAQDARLLPLWQGKIYIAASREIGGGERALDPQAIMQMWELYRKASW